MKSADALSKIAVFVGIPASIIGIILAFEKFWVVGSNDARVGLIILAILAVAFLAFSVFQEFRYSRKTRYAEGLPIISEVYQTCLEGAVNFVQENDPEKILTTAREICNELADAFSLITGTRCAVCIKVMEFSPSSIVDDSSRLVVATLCRDYISNKKRANVPSKPHWLDLNTDFDEMFRTIKKPGGGTFFENNLPGLYNYNNTSFEPWGGAPKEVRIPLISVHPKL